MMNSARRNKNKKSHINVYVVQIFSKNIAREVIRNNNAKFVFVNE